MQKGVEGEPVPFLTEVATLLLAIPVSMQAVAVAGFAVGIPIAWWTAPVALLLVPLAWRVALRRGPSVAALVLTGAVLLVSVLAAAALTDTTFDGVYYHTGAVVSLVRGWNPWLEGVGTVYQSNPMHADHYPRGAWIPAAAMVRMTGAIDAGKWQPGVLFVGSTLATAEAMRAWQPLAARWRTAGVSLMLGLNPVVLAQATTYYLDGLVASSLLAMAAGMVLVVRLGGGAAWWILGASLLTVLSLKMTTLGYAAVGMVLTTWLVWRVRGSAAARRAVPRLALLGALGVAVMGASPYVHNWSRHGHPLYPAFGVARDAAWHEFYLGVRIPPNLPSFRPAAFLLAQFARSDFPQHASPPIELKAPFTVAAVEWEPWASPDVKSGGFGPLYGGLVLLSLAGMAAGTRVGAIRARTAVGAVVMLLLLASQGELSWWARFSPHGWWLAWLGALVLLSRPSPMPRYLWHGWWLAVLALGVANTGIILLANVPGRVAASRAARASMDAVAGRPVCLELSALPAWRALLEERGATVQMGCPPGGARHVLRSSSGADARVGVLGR